MHYNFRKVDPTKKNKQKTLWIEQIPVGQFEQYNLKLAKKRKFSKKTKENIHRRNITSLVNEKLKGTVWTVDLLEKEYSDETLMHYVIDVAGNCVWFSPSFSEFFKRTSESFLNINFPETLKVLNKDHPFIEVFMNVLQEHPEEAKLSSCVKSSIREILFNLHLERIQFEEGGTFGFVGHLELTK